MDFTYTAIDENGATVKGSIQAPSSEEAMERLANRGLIPTQVRSRGQSGLDALGRRLNQMFTRVKLPDLILFTKQFRTLFKAGLPMSRLWDVMIEQIENPRLISASTAISRDIESGSGLSESFKKHPGIFSPLYCSMIQAGENSGRLSDVLGRLIYLLQHEHKVKSDVKSALQYPIMVIAAIMGAFLFLLAFVVPQFVEIFQKAGIDLPLPTKIMIAMHTWLIVYWPISLTSLIVIFIFMKFYLKTSQGRYYKDLLFIKMPVLGPIFLKGAMARFTSIFSILQASGVSVLNTLAIITETIDNSAVSREFERLSDQLKEGKGISGPLKSARFFTPLVVNMVAIGEESGNLDEMLNEASIHYDDEIAYAVGRITETITPLLTILLAGVVAFFALAIFMPMWSMVDVV